MEAVRKLADLPREKLSVESLLSRAQQLADGCKDAPGALRVYEQALKAYPDEALLLNNAAWFLLTTEDAKIRDAKKALPWAREAVRLSKEEDGNSLDTLAKALHDTGALAEAAKYGAMAARAEPGIKEIVTRARQYAAEAEEK